VTLVRLFAPEHGIRGTEDRENVESGVDERSGLRIHSLYTAATIGPPDSLMRMWTRWCSICRTSALERGRTWD